MTGPRTIVLLVALASTGVAASRVPWDRMTEADWIYALATRFSVVDGHRVHYPTPPAELSELLAARTEAQALRELADARMALGDRLGAIRSLEKWAQAEGPDAWAETARWAASHLEMAAAFRAAEQALPGLREEARRTLASERIAWADQHPEEADPVVLRQARAELFPDDGPALEDWLRALEKAGRLADADRALAASTALSPERGLLWRAELLAAHGDHLEAFRILDAAVDRPWSSGFRQLYASRVDRAAAGAPETWRSALDVGFDSARLVRLATYFQGQGRNDAVADLLRQMERRYDAAIDRNGYLLLARLHGEIGAVSEAFRALLAAAHKAGAADQVSDLAGLARLALRAGDKPLAWGTYNDESYRWVAQTDRTPGFWTGGVSFLLTGLDWADALENVERRSLPDRTFATARVLVEELERRAPRHADLSALRVAIMDRYVERGEGQAALALLAQVESGSPAVADEARRVALLAARQVEIPLAEEVRLFKARLRFRVADGGIPDPDRADRAYGNGDARDGKAPEWERVPQDALRQTYGDLLEEALARLEIRDRSHRASLDLMLFEMDRLPDAEMLWLDLARRLEGWNLDDEMGPRYERALTRFAGAGMWDRAARWYARRNRHADLKRLAEEVAGRFRDAEIFERAGDADDIRVEIPEQPRIGTRIRLVRWSDWIRLKALERFPHSALVFGEAGRLVSAAAWNTTHNRSGYTPGQSAPVIVADSLLEERRWALLFVDAGVREGYFADAMKRGTLEATLTEVEGRTARTPVEDLLLFEGWARLSRFERAVGAADRIAAAYPGDGSLAQRVLSLHRSLNGLDATRAAAARALVERAAPALMDPAPLWTELGELEEEGGRPQAAAAIWRRMVEREPRNPARISDLATLLWDYGHSAEALQVVDEGRQRLKRPRFFAFETGVLRENVKDVEGAVREYLDAVWPEASDCFCSGFDSDQRSLRRLAQLLSRERVFRIVEQRIAALTPGVTADEKALAAFFPLASIEVPDPAETLDTDDWIDTQDMPNDPLGRAKRAAEQDRNRPGEYEGIRRAGDVLLEKTRTMIGQATVPEFLDAAEGWSWKLIDSRWTRDRVVDFRASVLARRAELAASEEERIRAEVTRAAFLAENGRGREADAVWATLDTRIAALPEGVPKLRAEAARAGYIERTKGLDAAAAEWQRIGAVYPWSLGLLEDRLAFLSRAGRGPEGRSLLERIIPSAATGHRQALLERLVRDSLAASDLPRARRAVGGLLAEGGLPEAGHVNAVHLLARLSLKEDPSWDPFPIAKAQAAKLPARQHAFLYREMARAADLEKAWGTALRLWIEALNRRTQREWLQSACRSASFANKQADLLAFFEKQHERSPRDVRWAVAVRDIRQAFYQIDGAIEAARAAVAVRPDLEALWREAADLMVRADRVRDAADYLEGWNRRRAADEDVARWRGGLYARVGDASKVLTVERAALAAYAGETPKSEEAQREQLDRQARAAQRLIEYGYPAQALALVSPRNDARDLANSRLPVERQFEIALLNGQFLPLLEHRADEAAVRDAAAGFFADRARPEQKDELQAFLLRQIFPAGNADPSPAGILRWWRVAIRTGVDRTVRADMARRLLARTPGPWRVNPPLAFVDRVGADLLRLEPAPDGTDREHVVTPDLNRLWAVDLARRDRGDELVAFVDPRWKDLVARVRGAAPVVPGRDRLAWASWFDDPHGLATWAAAASARPDIVRELSGIMADRRLWDRFWALAARGWDETPLVALVPAEPRTAWFRFWEPVAPRDPVLLARRQTTENVSGSLGRLIAGAAGASDDPLVVRLRGPRRVGDVLGQDRAWTWPEFSPRQSPGGENAEAGDDRVIGQGADRGRLPGALWGDQPGEAWYVLEALARYRQRDKTGPLVPVEVPRRGGETDRTVLAMRMAQAMGDLPLALHLSTTYPGSDQNRAWLQAQLELLVKAGQKDKAVARFQAYLRRGQATLVEAGYRSLAALAEDLGLPRPLELLDPARPVGPAFFAYVHDRRPELARRFHTADPVGFRAALANRWAGRQRQLSASQIRFWLRELWASDSAPLPGQGLGRLGGLWPHSAGWLRQQPVQDRLAALDALEEAATPDVAQPHLLTLLERQGSDDVARVLAIRVYLARGDDGKALALVDEMVAGARAAEALGLVVPAGGPAEPVAEEDVAGEGDEGVPAEEQPVASRASPAARVLDPFVARLRAWLTPFRDARKAAGVEERVRGLLQEQREQGPVSTDVWRLAFELTPAAERPALAVALDRAWFRGHVSPEDLGAVTDVLAAFHPAEAPRWLLRWPREFGAGHTLARAALLLRVKDPAGAAQVMFDSRRRALWSGGGAAVFDAWRTAGAPAGAGDEVPAAWAAALPFWQSTPDEVMPALGRHLETRPHDVLAGRAAFRSVAPADEADVLRVTTALERARSGGRRDEDEVFLRLRVARGFLPRSFHAARIALGPINVQSLARDLVRRRLPAAAVNAALADVARAAARSGDHAQLTSVLAVLADRQAGSDKALRAELAAVRPAGPESYRVVAGRPVPIRPRDLTWSMLANVLAAEGAR